MNNKKPNELKMWLIIIGCAILLIGIGLILFLTAGNDAAGFWEKLWEAPAATIISIVLIVVGIFGICYGAKKNADGPKTKSGWATKELITAALCIGLSFVLSCIKIYELPNGGSITPASMLPIIIFAYVYGTPKGALVGLVYALLQMLQGIWFMNVLQFLLDYIFAFTSVCLAGLVRKNIFLSTIVGCLSRFVFAVLAGFYWIPEGVNSAILYSLGYNATYILPEMALCLIIVAIPAVRKAIEMLKTQKDLAVA